MQYLKGCLLLALIYSTNGSSASTTNVLLQCANGIHATMKDKELSVEGIFRLPFVHIENDTSEQKTLVFSNTKIEAKILFRNSDAKFFIQDSDGSWIPCKAYRITP